MPNISPEPALVADSCFSMVLQQLWLQHRSQYNTKTQWLTDETGQKQEGNL